MKLFSHRGNTAGAKPELENTGKYVQAALDGGYCVEIDVRLKHGEYWLGHDEPREKISLELMQDNRVLVHAKTVETFYELLKRKTIHSFYQKDEEIVLTSWGKKLYHEKLKTAYDFTSDEIYVDLECNVSHDNSYGIITDKPIEFKFFRETQPDKIFRLLILDVDGVMTDGTKTYDSSHSVISKRYCDKDFTAIKRFISAGIPVVLLSGCAFNEGMAKSRGLPFYNAKKLSDQLDKSVAAKIICEDFNTTLAGAAYVGDDYYDLSLLNLVDYPYCPLDAAQIVKDSGAVVINRKGGEGVIEALYELVKTRIIQRFPYE